MKALLIDTHFIVRSGLGNLLQLTYPDCVLFHEVDLKRALKVTKSHKMDLIIMEIRFPKGNSLKHISKFKEINPECKILIFTSLEKDEYVLPFLFAGAHGYLDKTSPEPEITNAIEQVLTNGQFYTGTLKEMVIENILTGGAKKLQYLSDREFHIARLLVEGQSNADIGAALDLHAATVSTYKKRILSKLDVKNTLELFDYLKRYGVV